MYITQSARRKSGQESRCAETGALSACLAAALTSSRPLAAALALPWWNQTPAQLTEKMRDHFKMRRKVPALTSSPNTAVCNHVCMNSSDRNLKAR